MVDRQASKLIVVLGTVGEKLYLVGLYSVLDTISLRVVLTFWREKQLLSRYIDNRKMRKNAYTFLSQNRDYWIGGWVQ